MKKKLLYKVSLLLSLGLALSACDSPETQSSPVEEVSEAGEEVSSPASQTSLEDGVYLAEFDTDSGMFHVNETCDGKGTLTVKDGVMTIHITLPSKNILNLYPGLAEDAKKPGAVLLEPTLDEVTYSDGITEEVHGFDVPVPVIGEEFDLALIGTKEKWYDHKVSVKNPVPADASASAATVKTAEELGIHDGPYSCEVKMDGGTGRATITSPCEIVVAQGKVTAKIQWSSPNYDYMKVDGVQFDPVNTEGNSTFEIPIAGFDGPVAVIGDTTAMSQPHEVEYSLIFDSSSIK